MHSSKDFDSDSESIDSVESVKFFKSVLSFMEEENVDEDSGFASFNRDICAYSGNWSSFASEHFSEPCYKTSNHFNKLALAWSSISPGSTVSAKETVLPLHSEPIKTPPKEFWDLISLNAQAERASKSVTQKNLLFIKYLKTGLLPDIQNHPARKVHSFSNSKDSQSFDTQKDNQEIQTINFTTSTPKKKTTKNVVEKRDFSRTFNEKQEQVQQNLIVKENHMEYENNLSAGGQLCKFCLKNGEPQQVYLGHTVKDFDGLVTCPILKKHTCELCGATGEYSHTRKYCPKNKELRHLYLQPTYKKLKNGVLTNDFVYYRV